MTRILTLFMLVAAATACGPMSGSPPLGPDQPVSSPVSAPSAGTPGATPVTPRPGGGPFTAVAAVRLHAFARDGHGYLRVWWYGGIEPCYALRPPRVAREGDVIAVRLVEGSDDPTAVCIEIALFKRTTVELGPLPPGDYTVRAGDRSTTLTV